MLFRVCAEALMNGFTAQLGEAGLNLRGEADA